MPTAEEKRPNVFVVKAKHSWLLRLAATPLVVAGCLVMSLPSVAADIPTSYRNQFRACAGRLENAGISGEAAAVACAQALYPVDLSRCVSRIERQTAIAAEDALATCSQVREPVDVARCVVGISRNNPEAAPVPGVLSYCGRSLLPATYGECVIGLRREIEIATTQALETCISTSDRPSEFAPTFIPQSQLERLQPPTEAVTPEQQQTPPPGTPGQPAPAPAAPPEEQTAPTAPVEPAPAPTMLEEQAPPATPTPAPTTPSEQVPEVEPAPPPGL